MPVFSLRCPVEDRERAWIDENTEWLRGQFGDVPVILPTREYFPPPFDGTDDDVRAQVARVAGYMGASREIDVEFTDDLERDQKIGRLIGGGPVHTKGAAGIYSETAVGGQAVITIDRSGVGNPVRLIAVIAHELGHVRLTGERRVESGRQDIEPLTDLATVCLGMGIFTANASFDFSQRATGWKAQHLGYMTEQMFGYALARYALALADPAPFWAKYLDTNPRVYMKQAIRYLQHRER